MRHPFNVKVASRASAAERGSWEHGTERFPWGAELRIDPARTALRCEYLEDPFKKMIDLRPSQIEHEQIVSPIAFTKMKKNRTIERKKTGSSRQFVCAEHLAIASSSEKSR